MMVFHYMKQIAYHTKNRRQQPLNKKDLRVTVKETVQESMISDGDELFF